MFVRLGFAVAAHCDPDILLVDEVLAVGDISFQSKCLNKIGEMRGKGITTIMVSHRMPAILGFCHQALYLNHGKLKYAGRVDRAIELHKRDSTSKEEPEDFKFASEDVKGSGLVRFTKVQFLDEDGNSVTEIKAYSPLILRIHYHSGGYTGKVELSIAIRDENGGMFFNATNESYKRELVIPKKSGYFDIFFQNMCANNQRLLFYITLWKYKRTELFDWKRESCPFMLLVVLSLMEMYY
jgi:lipopolysaccharide transport system ATP-binding protein